jgi:hypothetical protein
MEARHFPDRDPSNNAVTNLSWATRKANFADKQIHGTQTRGEKHHTSKLTDEKVRAMRAEYAAGGITQLRLGRKYGVNQHTTGCLLNGSTWKHVE